jgi:DNA replication protein DnaC
VNCYPQNVRDLFLTGAAGTGKTHLAVGMAQELVRRFYSDVLFLDFGGFVSFLLEGDCSDDRRSSQWECARQTSLLVLDNFGMIRPSAEKAHIAEELILTRIRARRRTIYTGESFRCHGLFDDGRVVDGATSTEKLLRALSPRALVELLGNARIILVEGQDYRMRKGCDHRLFG